MLNQMKEMRKMQDVKLSTVEVETRTGKHEITFTRGYEWVRLADVIVATGVKAGYSVATSLENLGYKKEVSKPIKDTPTRHHKYINVKEIIRLWGLKTDEVVDILLPSTYRNCKSFMVQFTDIMEEVIERNADEHIQVIDVESGEAKPADFDTSVDIILAELTKMEQLRKTPNPEQEAKASELEVRTRELQEENKELKEKNKDLEEKEQKYEDRYKELKDRYDEISKQRDDLIKKNSDLTTKNQRLIRALSAD
ncbi:MAG: hypothetical protein ACRCTS_06955 [Fusobacteriaceae bacterium]